MELEQYSSFDESVGALRKKTPVVSSDHALPPEVGTLAMKQLRKLTLTLGIVFLFVLSLANTGTCRQVTPVSSVRALPAGQPVCQPPIGAPPVYCGPPSFGPQPGRNVNWGSGSGLTCLDNACGPGNAAIRLDAQVGYGYLGLNYKMGAPFGMSLDLAFRDANVLIGSVGARAESCSGLFLAFRGQGNASRQIDIRTSRAPFDARRWDGSDLQWWALDADIGYRVASCWSALVGLRRDQLSVGLTHPKDSAGNALAIPSVPGVTEVSPLTMRGDFSSKLWIPYIGLEIMGQRYRASFLWSPFTSADIDVTDGWSYFVTNLVLNSTHLDVTDLDYRVRKTGDFLEYNVEYDLNVRPRLAFQLWSRGNWMRVRGAGDFEMVVDALDTEGGIITFSGTAFTASDSDMASCTKWMISGGIGATLLF